MHYVWEDTDANIFNRVNAQVWLYIEPRQGKAAAQSVVPEKTTEGARMHT